MSQLSVDRLMRVLSDILSEKYGARVIVRAIPKEDKSDEVV